MYTISTFLCGVVAFFARFVHCIQPTLSKKKVEMQGEEKQTVGSKMEVHSIFELACECDHPISMVAFATATKWMNQRLCFNVTHTIFS
jgi:hypothetical protein